MPRLKGVSTRRSGNVRSTANTEDRGSAGGRAAAKDEGSTPGKKRRVSTKSTEAKPVVSAETDDAPDQVEDNIRRSGRQRTVSSRLQDAQFLYSSPKQVKKRIINDETESAKKAKKTKNVEKEGVPKNVEKKEGKVTTKSVKKGKLEEESLKKGKEVRRNEDFGVIAFSENSKAQDSKTSKTLNVIREDTVDYKKRAQSKTINVKTTNVKTSNVKTTSVKTGNVKTTEGHCVTIRDGKPSAQAFENKMSAKLVKAISDKQPMDGKLTTQMVEDKTDKKSETVAMDTKTNDEKIQKVPVNALEIKELNKNLGGNSTGDDSSKPDDIFASSPSKVPNVGMVKSSVSSSADLLSLSNSAQKPLPDSSIRRKVENAHTAECSSDNSAKEEKGAVTEGIQPQESNKDKPKGRSTNLNTRDDVENTADVKNQKDVDLPLSHGNPSMRVKNANSGKITTESEENNADVKNQKDVSSSRGNPSIKVKSVNSANSEENITPVVSESTTARVKSANSASATGNRQSSTSLNAQQVGNRDSGSKNLKIRVKSVSVPTATSTEEKERLVTPTGQSTPSIKIKSAIAHVTDITEKSAKDPSVGASTSQSVPATRIKSSAHSSAHTTENSAKDQPGASTSQNSPDEPAGVSINQSTPSIRIKSVNAHTENSSDEQPAGASRVIMHLPGGVIHVSEDQGMDLVKLLEKGTAQLTEVQQLPGGMVCYAVQETEEDEEQEQGGKKAAEKEKVSALQAMTLPGADKLGLLGPVLNMQGMLECPYCEYTTDKKANWYKHKKKHSGVRRYECDRCPYKATTSSNLKRHYAIHMDVKQFMCNICQQMFRQKIHLERHIKYKHEMKQIKCSLCDYVCSNYNPDLKLHMKRQHQLEGDPMHHENLVCAQCGFVGNRRKDLRQHMKFHRPGPEVKLFCEQCSFITDCESRLARHMLTHTNEKPFACGLCHYRATQREHVVRHMITVHKVQPEKSARARKRTAQETALNVGGNNNTGENTIDVNEENNIAVVEENSTEENNIDVNEENNIENNMVAAEENSEAEDTVNNVKEETAQKSQEMEVKATSQVNTALQGNMVTKVTRTIDDYTQDPPASKKDLSAQNSLVEEKAQNLSTQDPVAQAQMSGKDSAQQDSSKLLAQSSSKLLAQSLSAGAEPAHNWATEHRPAQDPTTVDQPAQVPMTEDRPGQVPTTGDPFTEIAIKVTVKQGTDGSRETHVEAENTEDEETSDEAPQSSTFKGQETSDSEIGSPDVLQQSASIRRQEVLPIINQQKEQSIFARRVRLHTPYRINREKLFACMHCTMKFAKAINLYKHLKIQHRDMQPLEDGYFGCVLCEYKTTKRKNLLVHLRKHNAWPHETPEHYYTQPSKVFSCLLCDYKDPVRTRLYEHWKNQHKLQIVLRPNGTARCIMSDKGNGEIQVTELDEDNEGPLQVEIAGPVQEHQLVMTSSEAVESFGAPGVTVMQEAQISDGRLSGDEGVLTAGGAAGQKTVMLMLEPGMPATPVQINLPQPASDSGLVTTAALTEAELLSDAAESLQALAQSAQGETVRIASPVTAAQILAQTQQQQEIEGQQQYGNTAQLRVHSTQQQQQLHQQQQQQQQHGGTENSGHVEIIAQSQSQTFTNSQQNPEVSANSEMIMAEGGEDAESVATVTDASEVHLTSEVPMTSEVHLTSEQLMNLEAGDFIEINGETYKVEFQMDQ